MNPLKLIGNLFKKGFKKGKDKAMKEIILGFVRHGLTTGGGILLGHGLINTSEAQQGTAALMVLIGIVWSIVSNINKAQLKEGNKNADKIS